MGCSHYDRAAFMERQSECSTCIEEQRTRYKNTLDRIIDRAMNSEDAEPMDLLRDIVVLAEQGLGKKARAAGR